MSTHDGTSEGTAGGRLRTSVSFEPVDIHRRMTIVSIAGLAAAGLMAVVGAPATPRRVAHLGLDRSARPALGRRTRLPCALATWS